MGLKRATYTDRLGFLMRSFTPEMTEKFNNITQTNKLGIIEQYTVAYMIRYNGTIGNRYDDKNVMKSIRKLKEKGVISFLTDRDNRRIYCWTLNQ